MKIYEAYNDTNIRALFKRYIEAEGLSMSKCEQIYTRFGIYMSRIRGVLFDRMLLSAVDENDFKAKLNFIFYDKWKDHLGYPEIPDYFFRYLYFLHSTSAISDEITIEGLSNEDDARIRCGQLSEYERPYISAEGKLRILANPALIKQLKAGDLWCVPISDSAISLCNEFYSGCCLDMAPADWQSLIETSLSPGKTNRKRGNISFEVRNLDSGECGIYNSNQAMMLIVNLAGADRVTQCPLKLNGSPIICKRIPQSKAKCFKDIGDGYYISLMGTIMDRYKLMRALVSLYRLPLEIMLSKETAAKSPNRSTQKKQPATVPHCSPLPDIESILPDFSPAVDSCDDSGPTGTSPFIYGKDGVLNLFDDM